MSAKLSDFALTLPHLTNGPENTRSSCPAASPDTAPSTPSGPESSHPSPITFATSPNCGFPSACAASRSRLCAIVSAPTVIKALANDASPTRASTSS